MHLFAIRYKIVFLYTKFTSLDKHTDSLAISILYETRIWSRPNISVRKLGAKAFIRSTSSALGRHQHNYIVFNETGSRDEFICTGFYVNHAKYNTIHVVYKYDSRGSNNYPYRPAATIRPLIRKFRKRSIGCIKQFIVRIYTNVISYGTEEKKLKINFERG